MDSSSTVPVLTGAVCICCPPSGSSPAEVEFDVAAGGTPCADISSPLGPLTVDTMDEGTEAEAEGRFPSPNPGTNPPKPPAMLNRDIEPPAGDSFVDLPDLPNVPLDANEPDAVVRACPREVLASRALARLNTGAPTAELEPVPPPSTVPFPDPEDAPLTRGALPALNVPAAPSLSRSRMTSPLSLAPLTSSSANLATSGPASRP